MEEILELNEQFKSSTPEELITYCSKVFGDKITFASSLGLEDQVLTAMIANINKNFKIFTIDTGRLFPESYDLIDATNKAFGINMKVYFPNNANIEQMVEEKGINSFYHSLENRKQCCNIRKIEPLRRALSGNKAWICGLRSEQSVTRFNTNMIEWDAANQLIKINPLINWTEKQLWDFIKKNNTPYNSLHNNGFPSIGCQPCTRSIKPGEDIRSGRWWWEEPEHKECGLHKRQ